MSVRELEDRCIRERDQMLNTASDIQRKLSPGQVLDGFLEAGRIGGSTLAKLRESLSENPLLASLAGTGAAWVLFARKKARQTGAKVSAAANDAAQSEPAIVDHLKDNTATIASRIGQNFESLANSAAAAIGSANDKIAGEVSEGKEVGRRAIDAAESGLGRAFAFARNEPFVLLGAGLALGAALGAYAPATDLENEAIGKASDAFMSEARDKLTAVKEAGARLYETVKQDFKTEVTNIS